MIERDDGALLGIEVKAAATTGAKRPGDPPGGVFGVPRLDPWAHALLKLTHDGIGDTLIDICFH